MIIIGEVLGAVAMISGVIGGPTITPPAAVIALTMIPAMLAAVCHWLHAEQIAEHMSSMNLPNCSFSFFCVSVWYLFIDAGWNSGGTAVSGVELRSLAGNASPYCLPTGSPCGCCQPVGTLRELPANFTLASICI